MKTSIAVLGRKLNAALRRRGMTVATAESCTGGLVAAAITAVPGASDVFRQGFVVYADEAKTRWLGVTEKTLSRAGSVSSECAREMAANLEKLVHCDLALAVTGYAGPAGGTATAPVGTVWFGIGFARQVETFVERFAGTRNRIRRQAVATILAAALARLENREI